MPEKRYVHLDCDGILLDWEFGFRTYAEAKLRRRLCAKGPQNWSMQEWLGLDGPGVVALIAEFNHSPSFGDLTPCDGALEAMRTLSRRGAVLTVVTSCASDMLTVSRRKENLKVFGDIFDQVICLDLGVEKLDTLLDLPRGIWVEDNVDNARMGVEAGHETFVFRRLHNRSREAQILPPARWVDDWWPILYAA